MAATKTFQKRHPQNKHQHQQRHQNIRKFNKIETETTAKISTNHNIFMLKTPGNNNIDENPKKV